MAPSQKTRLTPAEKKRIRQMHDAGETRNAIAKALGRSHGAITDYCQREGLVFPHPQKVEAVAARELSVRERTVAAHERQLRILEAMQDQIIGAFTGEKAWKAKIKTTGGGESVQQLDFVPSDELRNIQNSMTSATTALKNLTPAGDVEKEAAVSVVEALAKSLGLPDTEAP
jgi:hypothetical protein